MEKETAPRRTFRIEQSPLEKVRLWIEIAAFTAAGCWALYTFVYQTRIAPSAIPAHEVLSISLQRLASTASGSIQRVQLTIRNDGTVDVDNAAIVVDVYGAAAPNIHWLTIATPNEIRLHEPAFESWRVLQAQGRLFDGAVEGRRGSHILLRPQDSFDLPVLVTVPHEDRLLRVQVGVVCARDPILPRLTIRLVRRRGGAVDLSGNYPSTNISSYFGV